MADLDFSRWEVAEDRRDTDGMFKVRNLDTKDEQMFAANGNENIIEGILAATQEREAKEAGPPAPIAQDDSGFDVGSISPADAYQTVEEPAPGIVGPPESAMVASTMPESAGETEAIPVSQPEAAPLTPQAAPINKLEDTHSRTQTQSTNVSPELLKASEDSIKASMDAERAVGESIVEQEKYNTLQTIAKNKKLEKEMADQEKFEAEVEQMKQDELNKLRTITDEIRDTKIDRNQLWHDMSTGGKVLASISLVMGAIGAAGSGGNNVAMEVLHKAIDRDIETQIKNVEIKKSAAEKQRGVIAELSKHVSDKRAVRALATAMAYEATAGKFQAMASTARNDQSRANAELAAQKLKQESLQKRMEAEKIITTNIDDKTTKEVMAKKQEPPKFEVKQQENLQEAAASLELGLRLQKRLHDPENKALRGPIAGRIAQAAIDSGFASAVLGENAKDTIRDYVNSNYVLAAFVKEISGAAVTDAERKWLASNLPSVKNSPEDAAAMIDEFVKMRKKNYENMYRNYSRHATEGITAYDPKNIMVEEPKTFKEQ